MDPKAPPAFTWPDAWRDQLAEQVKPGDKAFRERLNRFASPAEVTKSWLGLEEKVSSGKLKAAAEPLPENATEEQKTEWRKTNGLPETPAAYVEKLALPEGVVLGEADKPLVNDYAQAMFKAGASQEEMNRAVSWYYEAQDRIQGQLKEGDSRLRVDTEVSLKGEWGGDFGPNMNAFGAIKALMSEEVQTAIFGARTADGRLLGNTPELIKWGAQLGRELNPAAAIVLPGAEAGKSIQAEIDGIKASMYDANGTPNPAYWQNEKTQSRYRDLVDTQLKMQAKGK